MVKFLSFATSIALAALASRGVTANAATHAALIARQLPDPTQLGGECQTECSGLMDTSSGCTSLDCLCSNEAATSMSDCLSCGVALGTDALTASSAQEIYDSFAESCQSGGSSIPPFTFSGGSSGGSSSGSGVGSGTSSGSGSPSGNGGNSGSGTGSGTSGTGSGIGNGSGNGSANGSGNGNGGNGGNLPISGGGDDGGAASLTINGVGLVGAVLGAYLLA